MKARSKALRQETLQYFEGTENSFMYGCDVIHPGQGVRRGQTGELAGPDDKSLWEYVFAGACIYPEVGNH